MQPAPRLLFLSLAAFTACAQSPTLTGGGSLDHGAGAVIFPAERGEQVRWLGDPEPEGYWTPSPEQVAQLEERLAEALARGIVDPVTLADEVARRPSYAGWIRSEVGKILPRLDDYRRQYLGVVDDLGRRRIVTRFFPGPGFEGAFTHERWREELVIVSDGGAEYWRIDYLVSEERFVDFDSNGYA